MKIKRHFVYTVGNVRVSRTYGGADYTVTVYENKGKGRIVRVGEAQACTRAHRGEKHEAWCVITRDRKMSRMCEKVGIDKHYFCKEAEERGFMLQQV